MAGAGAQPVLIAGGGIGGLAVALGLAQKGIRSILLEKAAALEKAGALSAPYKTFRELSVDKDAVLDNPMFTVLDQPGIGRYPVAASPLQFGAMPREAPKPAPLLGQHTDEILSAILDRKSVV